MAIIFLEMTFIDFYSAVIRLWVNYLYHTTDLKQFKVCESIHRLKSCCDSVIYQNFYSQNHDRLLICIRIKIGCKSCTESESVVLMLTSAYEIRVKMKRFTNFVLIQAWKGMLAATGIMKSIHWSLLLPLSSYMS